MPKAAEHSDKDDTDGKDKEDDEKDGGGGEKKEDKVCSIRYILVSHILAKDSPQELVTVLSLRL